jgi:hypothetical protein
MYIKILILQKDVYTPLNFSQEIIRFYFLKECIHSGLSILTN